MNHASIKHQFLIIDKNFLEACVIKVQMGKSKRYKRASVNSNVQKGTRYKRTSLGGARVINARQ